MPDTAVLRSLRAELDAQLAALGKDPDKVTASAPSGDESRVFSLWAQTNYEQLAVFDIKFDHVRVGWDHRLAGDADGNGEVNISDLSALAAHLGEAPHYIDYDGDTIPVHYWPQGENSVSGNRIPLPGSNPYNWLSAFADTDGNGEVNVSDVTPIAVHLGERVTAWHVYKQRVGTTNYKLAGVVPFSEQGPFNSVIPTFEFFDVDTSPTGTVEYFVRGYDSFSGKEGPASLLRSFGTSTGVYPPPSAHLSADVTSGPAPFKVNFTATAVVPEGPVPMTYYWAFTQGVPTGQGSSVVDNGARSFSFNEPGTYAVKVWVRRSTGGELGQATITISVSDGPGPRWHLLGNYLESVAGGSQLSAAAIGNGAAVAGLNYQPWALAVSIEDNLTEFPADNYPVLGEVGGLPALATAEAGKVVYRHALDAAGTTWTDPVTVTDIRAWGYETTGRLLEINGRPALAWIDIDNSGGQSINYAPQYLVLTIANDAAGTSWPAPSQVASGVRYGMDFALVAGKPFAVYNNGNNWLSIAAQDELGTSWGAPVEATDRYFAFARIIPTDPPFIACSNYYGEGANKAPRVYRASPGYDSWIEVLDLGADVYSFDATQYQGRPVLFWFDWPSYTLMAQLALDVSGNTWDEPYPIDQAGFGTRAFSINGDAAVAYRGVQEGSVRVARYY